MERIDERQALRKLIEEGYAIRRFDGLRYDYELRLLPTRNPEQAAPTAIIIEYDAAGVRLRETEHAELDGAVETLLRLTNRPEAAESDPVLECCDDGTMRIMTYRRNG